jgi:hypothetical protein
MADLYAGLGGLTPEASTRMLLGESLIRSGRRAEGEAQIGRALEYYRSVRATFLIKRCQAALAEAQSASA